MGRESKQPRKDWREAWDWEFRPEQRKQAERDVLTTLAFLVGAGLLAGVLAWAC